MISRHYQKIRDSEQSINHCSNFIPQLAVFKSGKAGTYSIISHFQIVKNITTYRLQVKKFWPASHPPDRCPRKGTNLSEHLTDISMTDQGRNGKHSQASRVRKLHKISTSRRHHSWNKEFGFDRVSFQKQLKKQYCGSGSEKFQIRIPVYTILIYTVLANYNQLYYI